MTKRDVVNLLIPNILFIVIAIAALLISYWTYSAGRDTGSQQKFDTFVSNVQSGKWQLKTDKWLEGMRSEQALAEDYRKADNSMADMMQVIGWSALASSLLQMAVIFSVRKKLIKKYT